MSTGKLKVQPECADEQCRRLRQLRDSVSGEIAGMHKTKALLIAVQFAAEHDSEFVVSDALAAILSRMDVHMANLDQRVTQAAS